MPRMVANMLSGGVALSLAAAPALAQDHANDAGRQDRHDARPGQQKNHPHPGHWERGERYYGERVVFRDYGRYQLRPPPPGYEWVQDRGQFVLIGIDTGLIGDTFVIPIR